jgi:hypothetical protein
MNMNRRRFLKFVSAAGVGVAARITGLLPEAQLLAKAQTQPASGTGTPPWFAAKPVSQTELVGAAKDAAVKRMVNSTDFRNVAANLPTTPTSFAQTLAVESVHADGSRVLSVGATVDSDRVIVFHQQLGTGSRRTAAQGYMATTTNGNTTASLIGASFDGQAAQSHIGAAAATTDAATGGLVSAATCYGHWCYGCCGWDMNHLAECCGSCGLVCNPWVGNLGACLLCVGIWCQFCLYWSCNYWCYQCVSYRILCS